MKITAQCSYCGQIEDYEYFIFEKMKAICSRCQFEEEQDAEWKKDRDNERD